MSYYKQKLRHRDDYVPAAPIRRALREWLAENDLGEGLASTTAHDRSIRERYYSPYEILAARTGLTKDAVQRHTNGRRGYANMQFDVADLFLCATDRFTWWWEDPELSKVYESACKGADRIYPIAVAA